MWSGQKSERPKIRAAKKLERKDASEETPFRPYRRNHPAGKKRQSL
jgi:hypothetical protein